jgi:hypothetical protein
MPDIPSTNPWGITPYAAPVTSQPPTYRSTQDWTPVAGAITTAAGMGANLAGIYAQSNAQRQAAEAQMRASSSSLAYQRLRDAQAREDARRLDEMYQKRYEDERTFAREQWEWNKRRYLDEKAAREPAARSSAPVEYAPAAPDPRAAARSALQEQARSSLGALLAMRSPANPQGTPYVPGKPR